jgi:hypothetical protein
MFDPAIRAEIESDRAAGFPDPAATVRRLHASVGEDVDPAMSLVNNADAWWIGFVELPIGRIFKGEDVGDEAREIALRADEWWNELRALLWPSGCPCYLSAKSVARPRRLTGAALTDSGSFVRVSEKWGFGMAPPKSETQLYRTRACERLLHAVTALEIPGGEDELLEAVSTVKGLFNRVAREDQWDWFTVSRQLGYPSRRISFAIAREITAFRTAIKGQDSGSFWAARSNLHRPPFRRCLSVFLGRSQISDETGAGWIYVSSTREFRDLLKIGMTTRTVEQRAQEINGATGVAVPFGVRRCWRVSDPHAVERLVHAELVDFRLRNDREFFRVDFPAAAKMLDEAIGGSGMEIRTLDALAALAESD